MINGLSQVLVAFGGPVELSLLVKATVVAAAGLLAARAARRAAASTRHLVLASTFAGLLVLPATMVAVPGVPFEIPVEDAALAGPPASAPRARSSGTASRR